MIIKSNNSKRIDFKGLKIHDYTANKDTSSSLAVIHVKPGIKHPEAFSKRSDKYYFVIEGCISFSLAGHKFSLTKGDFCLIQKRERFKYLNESSKPCKLLLIHTPKFDINSEVFVEHK
jgi:mannose-6-phosphate isomerase-like protein (cupin superfamily)